MGSDQKSEETEQATGPVSNNVHLLFFYIICLVLVILSGNVVHHELYRATYSLNKDAFFDWWP